MVSGLLDEMDFTEQLTALHTIQLLCQAHLLLIYVAWTVQPVAVPLGSIFVDRYNMLCKETLSCDIYSTNAGLEMSLQSLLCCAIAQNA